jgi:hypothetical protein
MPKFSIDDPLYDLDTYWGRFEAVRVTINPLFFFNSDSYLMGLKKQIDEQRQKEQEQFARTGDRRLDVSEEEIANLKSALNMTKSTFSPDTGELIFHSGRFSNFIFYNLPITWAFVLAKPTPFNTIVSQWVN